MKSLLFSLGALLCACACAQSETILFLRPHLSAHIAAQIDSRIAPADATKELFATQDHTTPLYVRSTTCWARDIDLTCASSWNSFGGAQRAGTLISPRHILFAGHFSIPNGTTIRFVKMDGTPVDRTLTASALSFDDIVVGLLNADVPAGINFAKLLPASADGMFDNAIHANPRLNIDQEHKAIVNDIGLEQFGSNSVAVGSRRADFFETMVSGDSGSPGFVIIRGEAVLVNIQASGVQHRNLAAINATMTALGGGYQVTTIDLSEFNGGQ